MGQLMLSDAVQALSDAGIAAERGYPSGKMRILSEPVCAVNLKSADIRSKRMTVLATVLSPVELGAAVCEETALEVGDVLGSLGGDCTVAQCRLDSRAGLFSVDVTGVFATAVPKITLNGVPLNYVQAFTSWRSLDEDVTNWMDAKWNFRLEEYFPMGQTKESDLDETFTLVHTSKKGTESYVDSTWTYQRRVWDAAGVKQIRLGVCSNMEEA